MDEWLGDRRSVGNLKRSTLRNYQEAMRSFCAYIIDPAYQWSSECEQRFGTHPVQVVHDWNTAVHVADAEADAGKWAFTRKELIALFDHADEQVDRIRRTGRKGWPPAFRDAVLLKAAYGFRPASQRNRMLDTVDFGRNPQGLEFGEYGVLYVRHGKAQKGSPPKRRGVVTVWDWSAEILQEWIGEFRLLFTTARSPACWLSERGSRIGLSAINTRLASDHDELGLDSALDFHSLRTYVTHVIEDGFEARFVEEQAGHAHAGTTSIYTCVSWDYRTRILRRALDATIEAALSLARSAW